MRYKWLRLWKKEDGNVMLLVSLSLIGMLAMTGLVIDGGSMMMTRSHLQKAANAAVLSGAQELTNEEEKVRNVVNDVLASHGERGSMQSLDINMENRVDIELKKEMPSRFSSLFGRESIPVHANAAAELGTMGRAVGAAPLGIDESIDLNYGREYKLKVDQTEVEAGNFGILALGGPGAKTYSQNLRDGYQDPLQTGNVVETQTGNIAGKTRRGVRERIRACPYPPGEMQHRDCPRVLLVPVYKPLSHSGNQLKEVKVTGFAYFYITKPMDANDTSISGKFIKRAGTGIVDGEAAHKGAFSIRLTE